MAWYDDVIAVHAAVTDNVSHIARMKSDRYFVWEEEDTNILIADEKPAENVHNIITDLFTKTEFDSWVDAFNASLEESGHVWEYEFVELEPDTGFFHHLWRWYVNG